MVGVLLYNVSMDNQISTEAKKSKFVLFLAYLSLIIHSLSLRSYSFAPIWLLITTVIFIIISILVIFSKNQKIYNFAKVLLIIELIIGFVVPLILSPIIFSNFK